MQGPTLTDRERQILEAVIRTYVETAEPAGSRVVARRSDLGVSPATIRNAMSDLEEKGFLFHPHTSAGRVPTDLAYRYFVDSMMRPVLSAQDRRRLRAEMTDEAESSGPLDRLVRRALRVLGIITGELGLAVAPRLDEVVLEKIELARVSSDKILLVLWLKNGMVRTVYVDMPASAPAEALASVTLTLNERLAGLSLRDVRATLPDRLRDATDDPHARELVNIFVQSASEAMVDGKVGSGELIVGQASVLASQPEFSDGMNLRSLIELTEQRELLRSLLEGRAHEGSATITIGTEHPDQRLKPFTLITAEYRFGNLSGVLGVMGPKRMPYEKVAAIVEYTSLLMDEFAGDRATSERSQS
ncbi:MAG: heat-inducible transcriptional repressor HrcA [Gemmatimonadetes bacterium]|nr:heat-inducible transcriptional repressor HrcA [Gemmatimonadota bacterium]